MQVLRPSHVAGHAGYAAHRAWRRLDDARDTIGFARLHHGWCVPLGDGGQALVFPDATLLVAPKRLSHEAFPFHPTVWSVAGVQRTHSQAQAYKDLPLRPRSQTPSDPLVARLALEDAQDELRAVAAMDTPPPIDSHAVGPDADRFPLWVPCDGTRHPGFVPAMDLVWAYLSQRHPAFQHAQNVWIARADPTPGGQPSPPHTLWCVFDRPVIDHVEMCPEQPALLRILDESGLWPTPYRCHRSWTTVAALEQGHQMMHHQMAYRPTPLTAHQRVALFERAHQLASPTA